MNDRPVRVRIGPSPTGEPHVGTAYIALFNTAFAKSQGGKFILRIEDTDQERSRREWEDQIIAGLRWLGLEWDEGPDKGGPYGPYRQSERTKIYQEHVSILIDRGHAYRCFCTKERLDQLRAEQRAAKQNAGYDRHCRDLAAETIKTNLEQKLPFVVRMKMPLAGQTAVKDKLRGEVFFDNAGVDDQVLLKSDGFPTYHLANVVDDHLMQITHVIRAEEWINSTPKHVILYEMFGWAPPEFCHMPLLRNDDKNRSKISKRKNPTSILDYKQRGFLPEVVLNYLAMLGWTMPDGREVFTVQEFIDNFTWDRISLGGPVFDLDKLTWLNGKYFREKLDDDQLAKMIRELVFDAAYIRQIVPLVRERFNTLDSFVPSTEYFMSGEVKMDPAELRPKGRSSKELKEAFEKIADEIDKLIDFSAPALDAFFRKFAETEKWDTKDLFMPIRVAITGRTATPPLFETMSVLGRARVRRRFRAAIEIAARNAQEEAKQPKKKEPPKDGAAPEKSEPKKD